MQIEYDNDMQRKATFAQTLDNGRQVLLADHDRGVSIVLQVCVHPLSGGMWTWHSHALFAMGLLYFRNLHRIGGPMLPEVGLECSQCASRGQDMRRPLPSTHGLVMWHLHPDATSYSCLHYCGFTRMARHIDPL